jgi:hypothetical protein
MHLPMIKALLVLATGALVVFSATASAEQIHASCVGKEAVRAVDGRCNNLQNPEWGTPGTPLRRLGPANYKDGLSQMVDGPNQRTVSNRLFAAPPPLNRENPEFSLTEEQRRVGTTPDPRGLNMLAIIFGQFLSHDMDLTPIPFDPSNTPVNFAIPMENCNGPADNANDELCIWRVPDDPNKLPFHQKNIFTRPSTGIRVNGVFEPINAVTTYLDLSPVYGSDDRVAQALRTFTGGRLVTVNDDVGLPFSSVLGTPNDCGVFRPFSSAAGDERVDENFVIVSFHILFLREHNRLASMYAAADPSLTDEQIYQKARARNIAQFQHMVMNEWAPAMFGPLSSRLTPYSNYKPHVNPSIVSTFSSAAFRIHTMLNLPLLMLDANGQMVHGIAKVMTNIPRKIEERQLCEAGHFRNEVGPEAVLRGSVLQHAQKFDNEITNVIRNLRISGPGNGDVPAATLFRNREHGLPDYDTARVQYGMTSIYKSKGCKAGIDEDSIECFTAITGEDRLTLASALRSLYKKVNRIDAFAGLVCEPLAPGSSLGVSAGEIILKQLADVRDGDRFWFEQRGSNALFSKAELDDIRSLSFAILMRRHFPNVTVADRAFFVPAR